jgi:hypothetical protein
MTDMFNDKKFDSKYQETVRRLSQSGDPIKCIGCGFPTLMKGTKLCDGCYEVRTRLPDFVKTKANREFVQKVLRGERVD